MSSARNWLFVGMTVLGFAAMGGCWVDSSVSPLNNSPAAGSVGLAGSVPAAGSGAGSTPVAGSGQGQAGAPAAGAPAGGSAQGGSAQGGSAQGGSAQGGSAQGGSGTAGAGACPMPTGTHQATAIGRSCWKATASDCAMTTANMNPPVNALDGSATTRFSTGVKMAGQANPYTYQVDMGSAVMIAGIKIESAGTDYAGQLTVETSTDGTTWKPVACGDGTATATDFSFAATSARYVRFTQGGMNDAWWSIQELNVYGATGTENPCPTGNGPTGATCTTRCG